MMMHGFIHDARCAAQKNENRLFALMVISFCFLFALVLSFTLKEYVEPLSRIGNSKSEVVGWVSVHGYNKHLETVYYIGALVFIPLITFAGYASWIVFSAACAALTKSPLERTLKHDAFTYFAFLLVLESRYVPHLFPGSIVCIPLALFFAAKCILLLLHLRYSGRCSGDIRIQPGDESLEETSIARILFARDTAIYHGVPIAAGVCIAIFIYITGGLRITTERQCWEILLASVLGVWIFWIVYSVLLSKLADYSLKTALHSDSITYFPMVLLLLQTVLFHIESAGTILIIIVALAIVSLKILSAYSRMQLSSHKWLGILLNSVLIPCLIYAFLYDGNINHSGAIGVVDLYHEGEQVGPVNGLLRGKIPYRDIYLQHGLFKNAYVPLLAMKLFDENLESNRRMERIVFPFGFVCLYFLTLQFFQKRTTALLSIFFLSSVGAIGLSAYVPATDRHAFGFLALMLICMNIERTKHRQAYFLGAGICTTLAVLYSLETGLYVWFASCLFLFLYGFVRAINSGCPELQSDQSQYRGIGCLMSRSFASFVVYTIGLIIGFLPFGIYFGVLGALDDMFQNWWRQCIYQIPVWGTPFRPLSHELTNLTSFAALRNFILSETFIWYLPILIFLICLIYLILRAATHQWMHSDWKLLLILLAGIVFFRTVLGRSDTGHLYYSSSGYWLVGIFLVERAVLACKNRRGAGECLEYSSGIQDPLQKLVGQKISNYRIVITLLLLGGVLWYIFSVYRPIEVVERRLANLTKYGLVQEGYVHLNLKRAGNIQAPRDDVSKIEKVVNYLQANTGPNDPIFDFSNQGAYYFLADRPNPTRYYQMIYVADKAMQEEVISNLEEARPKYIIFTSGSWGKASFRSDNVDKVSNVERYPLVAAYINSHYVDDIQIGSVVILRRRE